MKTIKNLNKLKKYLIKQGNSKLLLDFFAKDIITTSYEQGWLTGWNTYPLDSFYSTAGRGTPIFVKVYYNRATDYYIIV